LEREKRSARSAEDALQQQLFAEEKKWLALEAAAKEAQILLEQSRKKVNDLTARTRNSSRRSRQQRLSPHPRQALPKALLRTPT
jgi:hypothetical protein